ncbi:hypothetical protein G4B88_025652 [Cannabis sativa]|uniref:Uncharacterized protein n=2 Tax=Cannabis sativa TaxID=3483 RepID=A0A7J6F420_CANSA|nr:hypothetical protein G4B88_025652 [Cannabis sativa]
MAAAKFNLTVVASRILKLLGSEEEHIVENEMLMGLKEIIEEHALVLLHAENKCLQKDYDIRFCHWMNELEDALCDAENLVDVIEWSNHQFISNCFISSHTHTPNKMFNEEINRVRRRLEKLAVEGRDFNLEKLSETQVGTMKPDKHAALLKEEDLFRGDKARLREILLNPNRNNQLINVETLPIVGKEESENTKLAKELFDDEMVRVHFNLRIWLSYGENIHNGVTNLKGKLYLIVLDGLRFTDSQEWDMLRKIFEVGAKGSKVIVTTQYVETVGRVAGTLPPYMIGMLSEKMSWDLFRTLAFKDEEKEESSYQIQVGKKIVKLCQGNPVVIKMLGSLLRTKSSSSEEEWLSFYENELKTINLMFFDYELSKLCYKHLPSPLKHCFAYCTLFPFRYQEYDVQTVVKLWMSQGFIDQSQSQSQSPEDAGYDYVMELLARGFFQASQLDAIRERVIKFHIHHSMHDLARVVSRQSPRYHFSIDNDFITLATDLPTYQLWGEPKFLGFRECNVRSIVVPYEHDMTRGNQLVHAVVSRFEFVRTLDIHGLGISRVPSSIKELKLLKYFDLSQNENITQLPHSITKLLNLQTLKLSSCYGLKRLPRRGFEDLINLRHLEIDGCYNLTSLPRGIHQLPNLQILSQLEVSDQGTSPNIGFNTFTKEVDIKNLGHEKFDMSRYLNVVSGVQSLSLEWGSNAPETDEHKTPLQSELLLALEELTLLGFRGNILFSANCPNNLVKLSLRKCVNCSSLPALEGLWNLKVLVLDELIKLEYISKNKNASSVATPFFPSLKELWLTELPKLQSWWRNEGMNVDVLPSFPCLSKLVIEDCPKLTSIPLFPTLEEGLALDSTCWKPFQLTLNKKTAPQEASSSSSSSSSPPLSNLKALRIVGIENFYGNEIEWRTLKSLEFLRFDCLPKLVSLPEGLQHVVSLQEFQLWRCGTEEIPEWIGKLHNLSKLMICLCPNLKSLPESIRELKLLETLEIEECDTLLRRCEKEIGADWEKICLIKNLRLGRIYDK